MPRSKRPRKRSPKVKLTPLGQLIQRLIGRPKRKVCKETQGRYAGRMPMIPQ